MDDVGAGVIAAVQRTAVRVRPRDRRQASLLIAGLLFVGIFVLRELSRSEGDAFSLLYVLPVAIVGLELGLRGGLLAALGAWAAVAVWLATRDLPFDATALAVRGAILFGVALVAGWFSDQMRASSAAVASENERLGALERDQAELQAEVERMRQRLGDQLLNATRVIERQERERRGIAHQLHEEAAQAMAAALVTVGLLERGTERELTRAQFDDVRDQVRSSIADLRRIATSLRPAVLDEMGLETALGRIAEAEAERNAREVRFATAGLTRELSPEAEAATYRLIQEVIAALDLGGEVDVRLSTAERAIEVVIDSYPRSKREDALETEHVVVSKDGEAENSLRAALLETRARIELVGGSLHVDALLGAGTRVVAELPL